MKLSASSSIFLATLALSSSTSTLAAPTRDAPESSLSVSPSSSDVFDSSVHSVRHCSAHTAQPQPTPVEGQSAALATRSDPSMADALMSMVGRLPMVGPMLESILAKLLHPPLGVADVEGVSTQNISSDDMAALQSAISEINRALNNTLSKAPSPVQSGVSGLVPVVQNDFDPSAGSASASPAPSASAMSSVKASYPSAVVNEVPSSSSASASPSASATPSSPPIPLNPPNTPTLPIHTPI